MVLRLRQHNIGYTADGFYRSDEENSLIKNLWQLKVTLLPVFLENSEPKTGQVHKFWQFWNELLYILIILLN